MNSLNKTVIKDFGNERKKYNQLNLDDSELNKLFENYFSIFPFDKIDANSIGFDMDCGSGRWARLLSPKVKTLQCEQKKKKKKKKKSKLNICIS